MHVPITVYRNVLDFYLYPNTNLYYSNNLYINIYNLIICLKCKNVELERIGEIIKDISISSVTQSCLTLCDPMDCRMPGFPVHHHLLEFTQTHVHQVGVAIQPSHPLLSPSPPTFSLSQHQDLFQGVSSSHQVVKVLECQLQHQSFH